MRGNCQNWVCHRQYNQRPVLAHTTTTPTVPNFENTPSRFFPRRRLNKYCLYGRFNGLIHRRSVGQFPLPSWQKSESGQPLFSLLQGRGRKEGKKKKPTKGHFSCLANCGGRDCRLICMSFWQIVIGPGPRKKNASNTSPNFIKLYCNIIFIVVKKYT